MRWIDTLALRRDARAEDWTEPEVLKAAYVCHYWPGALAFPARGMDARSHCPAAPLLDSRFSLKGGRCDYGGTLLPGRQLTSDVALVMQH